MEYEGREMTDRERFEAWHLDRFDRMPERSAHVNAYANSVDDLMWVAYQAATAAAEADKWAAVRRCAELVHSHSGALYDACHQAKHAIIAEFPEAFK